MRRWPCRARAESTSLPLAWLAPGVVCGSFARQIANRSSMADTPSDAESSTKPGRASLKVLLVPAIALALALAVLWSTPRLGALAPYELDVVSPPSRGGAL